MNHVQNLIGEEIRNVELLILRKVINKIKTETDPDMLVSGPNMFILRMLYENRQNDFYQKDIEKFMLVRKSTCSKILSTMQNKGLIKKESVSDARLNKIVITEKGAEYITDVREKILRSEKEMTKNISEDELKVFFNCIEKIKANLQEM